MTEDDIWDVMAFAYEDVPHNKIDLYFAANMSEYNISSVMRAWRAWVQLTEYVNYMPEVPDDKWIAALDGLRSNYSWSVRLVLNS